MRIASFGELLIDFVALEDGVTVGEASGFEKAPGGAPANVAVAVTRLGLESAFLTQVGDDPFGHFLADVLLAEGVNIDGVRYSDRARTMLAFVALAEGGERSFNFYRHPSADMLMTAADIATDVIDGCDLFHFGSITLISDPARTATLAAVAYARQQGKLISYDPNLRLALWESATAARAGMRQGLQHAHIVKVSEEEVDYLLAAGEALTDWWRVFPQLQVIALTQGAAGSTVYTRTGKTYQQAGYAVTSVDTTGAGDSFMAGLLVGVLERIGPDQDLQAIDYDAVLRFANVAGALATTGRGAIPSLPTRAQVDQRVAP